jgi:hypothetical protein
MRQKIITFIRSTNLEAVIWILGLSYLAIFNQIADHHFTICPIKNLGFSFCPGCGLGESISHLFRLEFLQSFISHPLGIIALPILVYRIIFLISKSFRNFQNDFSQTIGVKNNG